MLKYPLFWDTKGFVVADNNKSLKITVSLSTRLSSIRHQPQLEAFTIGHERMRSFFDSLLKVVSSSFPVMTFGVRIDASTRNQ